MKQEIAQQWTQALRSGQYEQGTGYLNLKNKYFCCLGVLCETLLPNHPEIEKGLMDVETTTNHRLTVTSYNGNFQFLGHSIRQLIGAQAAPSRSSPDYDAEKANKQQLTLLVEMNDQGKSFAEIANYIDAHWREI